MIQRFLLQKLQCYRRYTHLEIWRCISNGGSVNVFDRKIKRLQKNRACMKEQPETYDYLKDAIAEQVVDRVCDVKRLGSHSQTPPLLISGRSLTTFLYCIYSLM